jgi:hypothetical protein
LGYPPSTSTVYLLYSLEEFNENPKCDEKVNSLRREDRSCQSGKPRYIGGLPLPKGEPAGGLIFSVLEARA